MRRRRKEVMKIEEAKGAKEVEEIKEVKELKDKTLPIQLCLGNFSVPLLPSLPLLRRKVLAMTSVT
jgi:hypothetical protein